MAMEEFQVWYLTAKMTETEENFVRSFDKLFL